MKKDYKFHGYDFAELFECFEIPYGDEIPNMNYDIVEREDVEETKEEIVEDSTKITSYESFIEQLNKENPNWRQEAEEQERKEQESIKTLQNFIRSYSSKCWENDSFHKDDRDPKEVEEVELVYKKCIEFLDALIKDSKKWTYLYPLWKGLRKIKDKGTLLQMYSELINYMWT